jgi:tetratricopeptide (TPR) repeat protein
MIRRLTGYCQILPPDAPLSRLPITLPKRLAFLVFSLTLTSVAAAAPHVPRTDDEVLERLPTKPNDPAMREIRVLRADLARDPQNLELAMRLARRYFEQAGAQGDPRYVGYAQAALKPWWDLREPPLRVIVMRATLRQYGHDFAGALEDLARALEIAPADLEALSLRAAIYLVQADYEASRRNCARLAPHVNELTALGCSGAIDGMTGHARATHDALNAALSRTPAASPEQKLWLLTRLADMAWRLNDTKLAEGQFKRAFALDITDGFLLAAYADFLLDYGRPQEVIALLKDWTLSDPLLLRLALAEHAVNAAQASEHRATLADRFAAARLRGDTTHEQEESRFRLQLMHEPEEALRLAQSNWRVQREPRDARVLLEAALALKRPAAAQPVLDWMASSRIEDWYLQRLATQLAAVAK